MTVLLDWTRKRYCKGCKVERECFACPDGLRCIRCRPRHWTPPDAAQWYVLFRNLLHPSSTTTLRIPRSKTNEYRTDGA